MNFKILMYWDVKPGSDEEYSEFVLREWMPGVEALGIRHCEAWLTHYSRDLDTPQIMTGGLLESLLKARTILDSEQWALLCDKLERYVQNFSYKIVRTSGDFQL